MSKKQFLNSERKVFTFFFSILVFAFLHVLQTLFDIVIFLQSAQYAFAAIEIITLLVVIIVGWFCSKRTLLKLDIEDK